MWFDIIKIAPHEKKLGQTSEAWKEEIKDVQRVYEQEWPELKWLNKDDWQIGYFKEGTLWAKVIELNTQTLEKEIFIKREHIPRIKYTLEQFNNADFRGWPDDLSDNYCKMSLQPYSFSDIVIDTTWNKRRVNYFLDFWNKINKFDENNPSNDLELLTRTTSKEVIGVEITRPLNRTGMHVYKYYFPIFVSQRKIEYTGQSLDQIQKDFETQQKAHSKSYDLMGDIANQPNVRKLSEEEMIEILDNNYISRQDKENWVEVIGESGRVYYINTVRPKEISGDECTVDMFDNANHWYCTNTGTTKLPYGDFISSLILITLYDNNPKFAETVIMQN